MHLLYVRFSRRLYISCLWNSRRPGDRVKIEPYEFTIIEFLCFCFFSFMWLNPSIMTYDNFDDFYEHDDFFADQNCVNFDNWQFLWLWQLRWLSWSYFVMMTLMTLTTLMTFLSITCYNHLSDFCQCHLLGEFFFRRRKKNFDDEKLNFASEKYISTT